MAQAHARSRFLAASSLGRLRDRPVALALLALAAGAAHAADSGPSPITDANVAQHVQAARTTADHLELAAYYRAKAAAQEPALPYYDGLFRTYMGLEGRANESLQRQSRQLLKGARMLKKHFELLAAAHVSMAESLRAR